MDAPDAGQPLHVLSGVRMMAETLRDTRVPLSADHPAIVAERAALTRVGQWIETEREKRDASYEQVFGQLYGKDAEPSEPRAAPPALAPADPPKAVPATSSSRKGNRHAMVH